MPSFQQHLSQARHNSDLLTHLQRTEFNGAECPKHFSDWYVTIAFYSAVHFVEAIVFNRKSFVGVGKNGVRLTFNSIDDSAEVMDYYETTSPHAVRLFLIRDNPAVFGDQTYAAYSTLYEMSRIARYDCHATNGHDWIESEECLQDLKDRFAVLFPGA